MKIRYTLWLVSVALVFACNKNTTVTPGPGGKEFHYSDSVFYITGGAADYIVNPANTQSGTYLGFPEGLEIDKKTGAINVTKSESGLKYVVTFIPDGSTDTLNTFVTISGINYLDGFYNLSTDDSIANPLYNGLIGASIPGLGDGSLFDISDGCNSNGCNVIPSNAKINLAQTVRNGVFGKEPANNDRHEFELEYKIDDKSGKGKNKLKIKLYYFKTMADVTPEAYDIMASRVGTILTASNVVPPASVRQKAAKPRPPCIFIVGR